MENERGTLMKEYTEEEKKIIAKVDHTLLRTTATLPEIKALCEAALEAGTASVCIPPCYVNDAAQFLKGRLPVCTVIGFPNGYSTAATKVFEAKEAIRQGASEIDMVVNLCDVKNGNFDRVYLELLAMREACAGVILKVIIECCLLTEEEKRLFFHDNAHGFYRFGTLPELPTIRHMAE